MYRLSGNDYRVATLSKLYTCYRNHHPKVEIDMTILTRLNQRKEQIVLDVQKERP